MYARNCREAVRALESSGSLLEVTFAGEKLDSADSESGEPASQPARRRERRYPGAVSQPAGRRVAEEKLLHVPEALYTPIHAPFSLAILASAT